MAELCDTEPLFPGTNEVSQLSLIVAALGDLPQHFTDLFHIHPAFRGVMLPTSHPNVHGFNRYRSKLTESGVDLMKSMLNLDPSHRITADDALRHPYFDITKPKVPRLLMTTEAWSTRKGSKVGSLSSCTDRNEKSLEMRAENSKSADKQSVMKDRGTNVFFKFGQKHWQMGSKAVIKAETKMENKAEAKAEVKTEGKENNNHNRLYFQ
jgi:serine/threonine protein kinase